MSIDQALVTLLERRYAIPVIPVCRVCGKELSLGKIGGGEPSVWHCGEAKNPDGTIDWKHFNESEFLDRNQGGDPDVLDLIERYKSAVRSNGTQVAKGSGDE